MNREEFIYRMKYLNWHPLITVRDGGHELIVRALKDDKGELYGDKILKYDIVVDGIIGVDAETLEELREKALATLDSKHYELFLKAYSKLEVFIWLKK